MSRSVGRTHRFSILVTVLLTLTGLGGPALTAQEQPGTVEVQATAVGRVFDNFFRVADDRGARTIYAWTGGARVTVRPSLSPLVEIYGEGDYTRYETIGESVALGAGLVFRAPPHRVRLRARRMDDRPAFDIGDLVRTSDITLVDANYSYRLAPDWDVGVLARSYWLRFEEVPENDSRLHEVGGSVRYRAVGYRLQPEVGGSVRWRRSENVDHDNTEGLVHVGVIAMPVDPLWMNLRYRLRSRSFTEADPGSANFDRSDIGGQWTFAASLEASPRVRFNLYYSRLDMDSTLDRRTFLAQALSLGVTLLY